MPPDTQMHQPLISIVIPAYEQGRFLEEAVSSVLRQTYSKREIIVVDDSSTDNTPAIAAAFGASIRYIRKPNSGPAAARNTGILASHGDFVLCLDADDVLRADALEQHIGVIRRVGSAGDVFHGSWEDMTVDGATTAHCTASEFPPDVFHTLLAGNVGPLHRYLVRRSAFANAGIFDPTLRANEDWDLWLRLAFSGCRFVAVPEAVVKYRRYPNTNSRDFDRMWRTSVAVLRRNGALHGRCASCAAAVRRGIRHARSCCFMGILKHELIGHARMRRFWPAAARTTRALYRDPLLTPLLAKEALRYTFATVIRARGADAS